VNRAIIPTALIFSGAIQALASPPVNAWWVHCFALAPGFWALSRLDGKRLVLGGWLMGFSASVVIFSWVVHTIESFSNLPRPVAIALLGLFGLAYGFYMAVFAWGFGRIRRTAGSWWPLVAAAWFVACEFVNPQLFPFYQGVTLYQLPRFFLVTTVAGVPIVSFQLILWNLLLAALIERKVDGKPLFDRAWGRVAAVSAALLAFSFVVSHLRLGTIEEAEANADTVRIALVQTNQTVHKRRAMLKRSRTATLDDYLKLSWDALKEDPLIDVFVWPEGALRGGPQTRTNRRLRRFVKETGKEVWTGGTEHVRGKKGEPYRSYNRAFRVHGKGKFPPPYAKTILLPFGEFMPFKEILPILKRIKGVGNFTPGDGVAVIDTPHADFCFLICYEAIRHEYVREGVRQGAELLVNITYDAWFGDTACLSQHLMLSAIQSAEYGVPLVRAATTGITASVDTRGMILKGTEPFTRTVLVTDVKKVRLPTLYGRFGDWFAYLCVLGGLAVVGLDIRRHGLRAKAAG
jgi:apolipoprotein N-acyltransferase